MLGDKRYFLLRDSEDWDYIFGVVIVETTTEAQIQEAIQEFKEIQWAKQETDPEHWGDDYNLDCLLEFLQDKFVDFEFVSIDDKRDCVQF